MRVAFGSAVAIARAEGLCAGKGVMPWPARLGVGAGGVGFRAGCGGWGLGGGCGVYQKPVHGPESNAATCTPRDRGRECRA